MAISNYVLVRFVEENDAPGIVAANWLLDDETTYYPTVRTDEMKNKLLKNMAVPDHDINPWKLHKIRILKSYGK